MKIHNLLPALAISSILFSTIASSAQAYTVPTFPTCVNPQGELKVHYPNGIHGIVGQSVAYTGEDDVYQVTDTTVMQCFCPDNGQGIQTNWWNVANLDQSEISALQNQGWMYQPQGVYWGLDNAPYLAQNSNYSCSKEHIAIIQSISYTNPTTNGNSTSTPSPTNNNNSNSSNNVPQLANTGNVVLIYCLLLGGLVSLAVGFFLKSK